MCEINESRKTTTKVRVRKKVTRIVISENKRTESKTKMMMMLKTQVCLRYLVSTTGIMGLSVSCFLPTSNVFIQPTLGRDEDDVEKKAIGHDDNEL